MKTMIRLAWPVVLSFLGMMTMGLVDIAAVGRVSAEAVGSVGVGSAIFAWAMMFGTGLLAGLDYLVGFAFGADRRQEGYEAFVQSIYLSVGVSIPLTLLLLWVSRNLEGWGMNPAIIPDTEAYLFVVSLSLFPVLAFNAIRQYLQALNIALPAMYILLIGNIVNAVGNYALVFGNLGAPELGPVGSAWATLITRVLMLAFIAAYLVSWDRRNENWIARVPFRLISSRLERMVRLGFPSAIQMALEVGVFSVATAVAARLTAAELAAHQIVLNIASVTFMVPLGLSSATAVLVGQEMGRNRPLEARAMGWRGFRLGAGFMICSGLIFLTFPSAILGVYTTESEVIEVAKTILLVAALFQLVDGIQVVMTGALRGVADTRTPMIANLCGHWLVGFPLGVYLCFERQWRVQGLWIGLAVGLAFVAFTLLWKWRRSVSAFDENLPAASGH